MNYENKTKNELIKEIHKLKRENDSFFLSNATDITERKLIEKTLKETEEIFQHFLENSPIYVFFKDTEIRSLRLSKNYEEMLGRPMDKLLGKTMDDLFPSDLAKNMIVDDKRILNSGKPEILEEEFNGKYYSTIKFPIILYGKPKYLAGYTIDITDRMKSEKALEERTKELQNELEVRRLTEIELQNSLKELELSKIATLKLLEDVKTEMEYRRQAEEELNKLNKDLENKVKERTVQLEAVNKELESFAYSVSHDLRAPLRAIDGFSKFVLDDYGSKLDPEGKRLLSLIHSNTKKMDQLITDILALSRVTRSEHNVSEVDMEKMAISMYNECVPPESRKKLTFIIDPMPVTHGDPTYLKLVWTNLISNAIKFSSKKSKPRINLGGYTEKGFNIYFVKDNGAGFNPDYTHKLYGVFQRLHKTEEFEGTGIGLAIIRTIILRHGGQVWAEGKEGEGATFYFSIPLVS
jgi:PAS domain S-box-containing protein